MQVATGTWSTKKSVLGFPMVRFCQEGASFFGSVQLLSHVWCCTPWTAACQSSLSITNSQSLLKLISLKSVMPSNYLILCHPLLLFWNTNEYNIVLTYLTFMWCRERRETNLILKIFKPFNHNHSEFDFNSLNKQPSLVLPL